MNQHTQDKKNLVGKNPKSYIGYWPESAVYFMTENLFFSFSE